MTTVNSMKNNHSKVTIQKTKTLTNTEQQHYVTGDVQK